MLDVIAVKVDKICESHVCWSRQWCFPVHRVSLKRAARVTVRPESPDLLAVCIVRSNRITFKSLEVHTLALTRERSTKVPDMLTHLFYFVPYLLCKILPVCVQLEGYFSGSPEHISPPGDSEPTSHRWEAE